MKMQQRGVTLVEIALVLAVIGLLLGGVLKGQELINSAKVRALADQQSSIRVAWYAFSDRFRAMPGDYVDAADSIPGAGPALTGAGSARPDLLLAASAVPKTGDGIIEVTESGIAFQNMAGAGLLRCTQCRAAAAEDPSIYNAPTNIYGGAMSVWHNNRWYAALGYTGTPALPRLLSHTGHSIPSNVIAEVDRKLDDGLANTGDFVFTSFKAAGSAAGGTVMDTECMADANSPGSPTGGVTSQPNPAGWRGAQAEPSVHGDCGAGFSL